MKWHWWKIKRLTRESWIKGLLYGGRCAGCGTHTHRWCFTYHWNVCKDCDTNEIARDVADHVCNPNG